MVLDHNVDTSLITAAIPATDSISNPVKILVA